MKKLTVLMTVYNGSRYLRESIESILDQTYRGFKFLIVDNASTDDSRDIVLSYNDPRIELVALPQNIGQIRALNKGLSLIDTPYMARMDADDISLPDRFEKQVNFLDSHPEIAVCGNYHITFNEKEETIWYYPLTFDDIKVKLLFECCMPHPSLMFRKTVLDEYGLKYDEELGHSEDWKLFHEISRVRPMANIPEVLFRYRIHGQSVTRNTFNLQYPAAYKIDDGSLGVLGLKDHPLRKTHRDVGFETFNTKNREAQFLEDVVEWFKLITDANNERHIYNPISLEKFLKKRLFIVLTSNTQHRKLARRIFFKEKCYKYVKFSWSAKFITKLFLNVLGIKKFT